MSATQKQPDVLATGPPEQKSRAATSIADTGQNLEHKTSYPRLSELQHSGELFAAAWSATAIGFAACFFAALTLPCGPAIGAVLAEAKRADLRLYPLHFPTTPTWNLIAILCAFAENGERPTPEAIIGTAKAARLVLPIGGGDEVAELREVLDSQSSAALLLHYGRELIRFHRKAGQVNSMWRVLGYRLGSMIESTTVTVPVQTRQQFSDRAIALVKERP